MPKNSTASTQHTHVASLPSIVSAFWSPCFGMLIDKFNVSWMMMGPGPTPGH
jgi:uncharacterized glyoxalase superfamily protein PhnB